MQRVQGHSRLARVRAMCVHSCVSWPRAGWTPCAPCPPLSASLCSWAAGGRVGSQLGGLDVSGASVIGGPAAGGGAPLPGGRAGGARSAPVTGAGGCGWVGGGRQAIHLLLLQRNGAARAPAHLSSASFADNGHLSSLSSAPMSSAPLTGGGGGRVPGLRRAHAHAGLLDTSRHWHTKPGPLVSALAASGLPGRGTHWAHAPGSLICLAGGYSQLETFFPAEARAGEGPCWHECAPVQVGLGQRPACPPDITSTSVGSRESPAGSAGPAKGPRGTPRPLPPAVWSSVQRLEGQGKA